MSTTASSLSFTDKPSRLPRWVNNLLVIALGISLALLTFKLLPQSVPTGAKAVDFDRTAMTKAESPLETGNTIAQAHLFGDVAAVVVEDKPESKAPPKENTTFKLAGVFAFEPQELAIAIISAGSEEQNAYGIGDKISGETTLKAVYPEYVLLDNQGQEEIVRLPENSTPVATRPIQNAPSAGGNASNQAGNEDYSQPLELPSNPGELRDALARNPSMLGRIVAAEPYQENGKLVGYRITPKQNPEILEAQGIIAGDIITRVNNIQLNSQKQGIRALRNAVKAENLEVVILRDGVEVPVSISLAQ
ncbi:MAG: type II secretion system protein GspC [Granulosicoccus sp.]